MNATPVFLFRNLPLTSEGPVPTDTAARSVWSSRGQPWTSDWLTQEYERPVSLPQASRTPDATLEPHPWSGRVCPLGDLLSRPLPFCFCHILTCLSQEHILQVTFSGTLISASASEGTWHEEATAWPHANFLQDSCSLMPPSGHIPFPHANLFLWPKTFINQLGTHHSGFFLFFFFF